MTKSPRFAVLVVSLFAFAIAFGGSARAAIDAELGTDLEYLSTNSNLIFIGDVISISYGVSQSGSDGTAPLPFTFVTYKIEQVLRGTPPARTFTMRFIGGPNNRGDFLTVSRVPHFHVHERDLLFVSGNGAQGCPLVSCQSGRYRILENRVYSNIGVPIKAIEGNRAIAAGSPRNEFLIREYPAPTFEVLLRDPSFRNQIQESNLPIDEIRALYEKYLSDPVLVQSVGAPTDEDVFDQEVSETHPPSASQTTDTNENTAISVELLLAELRVILTELETRPIALNSIDLSLPFSSVSPTESEAPSAESVRTGNDTIQSPQSRSDREELRILEQQGFNPVIRQ